MPHKKLQDQVAWITGTASGIGQGIAEFFAEQGARTSLVDINHNDNKRLSEKLNHQGTSTLVQDCDVADETQVHDSIEATVRHFGNLNIIVNCAAAFQFEKLHRVDENDWDHLMAVNVKSIYLSIKHGITHLKKNPRSYMVNIGSVGSFIGQADTPAYITTKGAVLQLTRSIALDYAQDGLRCNCVCPGITDTAALRRHLNTTPDPQATLTERLSRVPMGILMKPRDIAKAVCYLSCDDSSGVTATSLIVDGGYIAPAEWQTAGHTRFMDEQ